MGKGHDYENRIANEIYDATPHEVKAYRCGYSGNMRIPQPDVLVTTPTEIHAIELKHISSNRTYIEADDFDQLLDCQGPRTGVWLIIKFTHREPVCVRYYESVMGADDYNEMTPAEQFAYLLPDAFDAHVTDSGNLRVDRPTTDEWQSTQGGRDDVTCIVSELGIENESSWSL